jgi:tRNA(fMet)-specific endonuclease VapC
MELPRAEWSDAVTEAFGRIKAGLERRGRRIEDFDAAIAAHAAGEGTVLVSSNADDISRIPGIKLEDWSR